MREDPYSSGVFESFTKSELWGENLFSNWPSLSRYFTSENSMTIRIFRISLEKHTKSRSIDLGTKKVFLTFELF